MPSHPFTNSPGAGSSYPDLAKNRRFRTSQSRPQLTGPSCYVVRVTHTQRIQILFLRSGWNAMCLDSALYKIYFEL